MNKPFQISFAFFGIWIVACAIADMVIKFETNSYAMAWGVGTFVVWMKVADWLEKDNSRGRDRKS